jgi:hypothetical protein
MTLDMSSYGKSRWVKTHPNHVYTFGALEPVLSILDVRGFSLHNLFLMGMDIDWGTILFPTESRAENAAAALEPAYETRAYLFVTHEGESVWATDYTRRALDGTTLSAFITNLTLKDGRQVIKDGRWVR